MADKPLKSITFPGLADKYMIPEIDSTLTQQGEAADAKKTGDEISDIKNTLNTVENGLAIIVNGDTCSTAVPVGGYAYIKNNTHGLAEGLYTNTSASAFPTSGGTANSSVFTAVSGGGLNSLKTSIDDINNNINTFKTLTDVSTAYTTLDSIPINALGRIKFNVSISPTGGNSIFAVICFGNSANYRMIVAVNLGDGNVYSIIKNGANNWRSWKTGW